MRHLFICLASLCLISSAAAEPVIKKLGTIDAKEVETRPAKELSELARKHPDAKVYVVTATAVLNENVTDYYKWIYDAEKKVLAQMMRTAMRTVGDEHTWAAWHDVSPSDFAERIPFGNDKLKASLSPFRKAVQTFPLKYPDSPAIAAWP